MKAEDRKALLWLGVYGVVGLLLLDSFVFEPFVASWREQGERIDAVRKKVDRGEQLLAREKTTRARWAAMVSANLPADDSMAQDAAYKAISRWVAESGITLPSLSFTPAWQTHDEGYETLECRVAAIGDQASLGKFIHALETDPIPVNLEECELTTRDAHGTQLGLAARFTFLRLETVAANNGKGAP
jgi:hypothetical protein